MKLREREAPCLQLRVGGLEDLEAKPVCWIIGSKVNSCHGSLEIDRATSHEGGRAAAIRLWLDYSAVVAIAAAVTWGIQDVPPPETQHHPCLGAKVASATGFYMQLP